MKHAAITGHTSGLGYELSKLYPDSIGFSLSSGYDISNSISRKKILLESYSCDIFFNNAHCGFYQVDLLYELFDLWKDDPSKTIVNISSNSPETSMHRVHKYAVEKNALDVASDQLYRNSLCKVILVKPPLFISERSACIEGAKECPKYIAQQIKHNILLGNDRFLIPPSDK